MLSFRPDRHSMFGRAMTQWHTSRRFAICKTRNSSNNYYRHLQRHARLLSTEGEIRMSSRIFHIIHFISENVK